MKTKLAVLFIISSFLFAQTDVMKKVQNKFNSLNNFTAAFSQTYNTTAGVKGAKTTGKFSYKRKNKFIVELANQFIVSDGQTIWNLDKRYNRVVVNSLENDPTSFSLEKYIFDFPKQCKVQQIKDDSVAPGELLVELTPNNQDMEFKSAKLWITSDGLISKMEIIDRGNMKYGFQFSEIKLNQDLPDSKFTYYPSKGIQIIDLR